MTDLGTFPGDTGSGAGAINDRGQIVGNSFPADGGDRAVMWDHGTVIDLGSLPGATVTSPQAINAEGEVVGTSGDGSSNNRLFLWADGKMTDLGPAGGGEVIYLNDHGQIALSAPVADGSIHTFFWDRGQLSELTPLPGEVFSQPTGLNDRGDVIGDSYDGTLEHAVLWRDGHPIDLGTLGIAGSVTFAINDRGQVAGGSFNTAAGLGQGFLWQNGTLTPFGPLGTGRSISPGTINATGDIIGFGPTTTGRNPRQAFVWHRGTLLNLGTLGGTGSFARAVNNEGAIVGQAQTSTGRFDGVLWTVDW